MEIPKKYHFSITSFLFLFILFITWLIYHPGLQGPFLFDDFHNLQKIGALGQINTWELFRAYLHSGFAGPTGRPISLASFLINDNDWPADPYSFKQTNILIHLLIGVLLFGTFRSLLRATGRNQKECDWLALFGAALWLFNPFLVSTTLYVVQRMTQLAALFSILGIWGYLQGRSWLKTHPIRGYFMITGSLGICTLLATFSKENGALLPTLILMIELSLAYHWKTSGPDWRWKAIFLWLPTLAILAYLARPLGHITRPIPTRDFNLLERLLTEARILWDYLFHLFIPHIQTHGLYQDGLQLSHSILSPWTTLPSVLGIFLLATGGWLARKRFPLVSLAILFFLAGQLIESTTVALELYFEHRNYLPSIFLFLMLASGIFQLGKYLSRPIIIFICISILSAYSLSTWQRAKIWGNEPILMLTWARMNPASPRAQIDAARVFLKIGQTEKGMEILDNAIKRIPNSSILITAELSFKAELETLTVEELKKDGDRLRKLPFDAQMLQALKRIVEVINAHGRQPEQTRVMMNLLEGIRSDLDGKVPVAHRYTYYLQGLLAAGQGEAELAYRYFVQTLKLYNEVETGFNIVSVLATFHDYPEAMNILDQTNALLENTPDHELVRSRETYKKEISRLRQQLESDYEAQKSRYSHPQSDHQK